MFELLCIAQHLSFQMEVLSFGYTSSFGANALMTISISFKMLSMLSYQQHYFNESNTHVQLSTILDNKANVPLGLWFQNRQFALRKAK